MRHKIESLLNQAGITVNGDKPYDIQIHNDKFYGEVIRRQLMGAGESYVRGWWDCERLDEMVYRLLRADLEYTLDSNLKVFLKTLWRKIFNQQTRKKSRVVAEQHYNLDNALYEYMLGPTMAYTCAYWKDAQDLDTAQYAKFDLVCKKVNLQKGQRILDLGCGWGGFAKYAAEKYGVEVVAVNIADEQIAYGKEINKNLPVTFYSADYRDHHIYNPKQEKFDHIISIGICEHVGVKNYRGLMDLARKQLKGNGLFLIHTIGSAYSTYYTNPWVNKYLFPNAMLPSINQLSGAAEKIFVIEDVHNFGADYDKTLMAWDKNFRDNWDKIKDKYDDKFYRMWRYYLMQTAGGFRARDMQLWHIVLSPHGVEGGYVSVR